MTGIINFIDHNYSLLENHLFLSICWNMINYHSNIFSTIDINNICYFSKLKIPHSSFFSFLTNSLDKLYTNQNYIDFFKFNKDFIPMKEHTELYNLIYYSELKKDNQIDFFFNNKPNSIPVFNVVDNEFYYVTFNCNLLHQNLKIHECIYRAFSKNHPFFLLDSSGTTFKFRVITHYIPNELNDSLYATEIGVYYDPLLSRNKKSYALNVCYEVPKSFISKMSKINISKKSDVQIYKLFLNNDFLTTMPKHIINPLQLSIYSNYNYNEPIVNCIENIEHDDLYNDAFQEVKQKIKLYDGFNDKSELSFNYEFTNIEARISNTWKKI